MRTRRRDPREGSRRRHECRPTAPPVRQSIGRPKAMDDSKASLAQGMHASGESASAIATVTEIQLLSGSRYASVRQQRIKMHKQVQIEIAQFHRLPPPATANTRDRSPTLLMRALICAGLRPARMLQQEGAELAAALAEFNDDGVPGVEPIPVQFFDFRLCREAAQV